MSILVKIMRTCRVKYIKKVLQYVAHCVKLLLIYSAIISYPFILAQLLWAHDIQYNDI
jgi:hypothetical protein